MSIDKKLEIDPTDVKFKIVKMIRSTLEKRGIEGLLIPYKYCIESITNIHLAIDSIGRDNVKVLVTKGTYIHKQPREEMNLESINKYLNLPSENIIFTNKERILSEIRAAVRDTYDHKFGFVLPETIPLLNYNLSYFLLRDMAKSEIEKKTFTPPTKKPVSEREKFIQKAIAHYKSQIRTRVLLSFLIAESENMSLIGNANRTEWLLGLFTKFGTYHAADFLPLACLYRTQVIQLANHLGFQEFLNTKITKEPSSYKYFFDLPVEEVDRILIRLESGYSVKEIFEETKIPLESIKKVDYYHQASIYARMVPLIPEI